MKTNWENYHGNLRQATIGRIPQYFHWKAYLHFLKRIVTDEKIDILELGSGTGINTFKMCDYFDVRSVTLVDSNSLALRMSEKMFKPLTIKKTFIKEDVTKFHAERKFHLVHSHGVIEHFSVTVMHELVEKHIDLARPDGYVIIFVPTPTGNYIRFRKACETLHIWPFPDERPVSKEEIISQTSRYNTLIVDSIIYSVLYPTLGLLIKKIS
jgi:cyclopropane fatty-acyl-phospholipid synthase-like methyltransferase